MNELLLPSKCAFYDDIREFYEWSLQLQFLSTVLYDLPCHGSRNKDYGHNDLIYRLLQ